MSDVRCKNGHHVWARTGTFRAGDALCECGLVTVRRDGYLTDGTVVFGAGYVTEDGITVPDLSKRIGPDTP